MTTTNLLSNNKEESSFWDSESVSLLALSSLNGIGYWTLFNLAKSVPSLKGVLEIEDGQEVLNILNRVGGKISPDAIHNWPKVRDELWLNGNRIFRQLRQQDIQLLHLRQTSFPSPLHEIPDCPKWLFVQGNVSVLHQQILAIVGTRTPTSDGKFLARYIGACLPYIGGVTVSGLAPGIDQIVHKFSLRFDIPTIAFLGTGFLLDYPAGTVKLKEAICASGGALVTEYLPTQTYSAKNFVRRNRLQAGIASTIIPVEWTTNSGTAHTVRYANKYRKKIICLKMPDWDNERDELVMARRMGAEVITIPGQEHDFLTSVRNESRSNKQSLGFRQPRLLGFELPEEEE